MMYEHLFNGFPLYDEEKYKDDRFFQYDFLQSLKKHILTLAKQNDPKTGFYFRAFIQKYYEFYPNENFAKAYLRQQGKKNGAKNWKKHNEQTKLLAQRYLQTMRDKGFKSYNQTAEWIFLNDNAENKKYEWILKKLKQADKKQL